MVSSSVGKLNFKWFLIPVVFLLFGLSGCNNENNGKPIKAASSIASPIKLPMDLIVQNGKAISLEPLTIEQCFGETYTEVAVKKLLNGLYRDGLPVSGLGMVC